MESQQKSGYWPTDFVQRTPFAQWVANARLLSHRVAAAITYGCSLPHIRLQPPSHTIAASSTYSCSLCGMGPPLSRTRRAEYNVLHLRLSAVSRARFNATAAREAFESTYEGLRYGFPNLLWGWSLCTDVHDINACFVSCIGPPPACISTGRGCTLLRPECIHL